MKLTDLLTSQLILNFVLNTTLSFNLLLIIVLVAALLTLTKALNNKYSFLKNLFVLKYVHQLR